MYLFTSPKARDIKERINKWDLIKIKNLKKNRKAKAFLYTKNETAETEIRKKMPFDIATRKIKYLGVNLTKEVKIRKLHRKLRKLHNSEERN